MKRLLALILALTMMMCGCSQKKESETSNATTSPITAPEEQPSNPPSLEFGCYQPDSDIEVATNGAVKTYQLDYEECFGILTIGDGLLLLSGDEESVLTYIEPDGDKVTTTLDGLYLFIDDFTVISQREAVAYFDENARAMVLLDCALKEIERVELPENAVGKPVVDSDWSLMYYLTEDELRCMNLSTGIDRMLKQISFDLQELQQLHFGGSLLECLIMDDDKFQSLMISTKNGELVYSSDDAPMLLTNGNRFFATMYSSDIVQYLVGTRGEDNIRCLNVDKPFYLVDPEMWAAITCDETATGVTMNYYNLETGMRSSAVELPMLSGIEWLAADISRNAIWFFAQNQELESQLYRWDISLSETGDTESYMFPYFTVEDPDTEGLQKIEEQADALGLEYGLHIRVYEDALKVQPSDYIFELEHMVPIYERYLSELEGILSSYPDGFLKKVGKTSDNGKLTISLIGGAYGDNGLGSLETADGVHFYDDGNVYIAVVLEDGFRGTLCHELFHAIDTYVLSHCNVYDDWDKLNPKGFRYDNDYVANQFREDYQYLEEDRWFIDMYSMSYAKEDRARIMEYAMESGNEDYFASEHMQAKLQRLCKGIRKAFGLQSNSTQFVWEQYLK